MTREEAKQWLEAMKSSYALPTETYEALDMAIEALEADTVEVVRCKDCRFAEHREQAERVYCHRERLAISYPPRDDDDFCKYGERSE